MTEPVLVPGLVALVDPVTGRFSDQLAPPSVAANATAAQAAAAAAETSRAAAATAKGAAEAAATAAAVAGVTSANAVLSANTDVFLGHPDFALPASPTPADAALAAAYAATPTGGVLDCGNRDIVLSAQFTISKQITLRGGRFLAPNARAFLVTAAGVVFDRVKVARTGGGDSITGVAVTWNATNGTIRNCVISSTEGGALNLASGNCDGTQILGGSFTSANITGDNAVISASSGAKNNRITVDGVTVRHTGYGTGIALYNSSNSVVRNCDVQGIRATPWADITGWTLVSGTTWRALDRPDIDSNVMWVGTAASWGTTKVEYVKDQANHPTPSAGTYSVDTSVTPAYLHITIPGGTNPNTMRVRVRRTNGYGILFYATASGPDMSNNLAERNYVKDCDGSGIYFQTLQGAPQTNRTLYNVIEDTCLLGQAVQALPYGGFASFGGNLTIMHGDVIRRVGTSTYPTAGVNIIGSSGDADSEAPSAHLTDVFVTGATQSGFVLNRGWYNLKGCRADYNTLAGFRTGTLESGFKETIELVGCEARGNGQAGANFSGSTTFATRVEVNGGTFRNNGLRGVQLNHCKDSRVVNALFESNSQYAIHLVDSLNLYIAGNSFATGNGVLVDSQCVGLTLIPGTEDSATPTKYNIAITNWRTGHNRYAGTGSPETVLAAPVGSTYSRTDGGTGTGFYVKETGTGTTGWVAQAGGGGSSAPASQWDYLSTLGTSPALGMLVGSSSQAITTANTAYVVKVKPLRDMTLNSLTWFGGATSAGNYDIGIYNAAGTTKLWSKGSTAWPAANVTVDETVSPGVALTAGTTYLVVISGDTATSTFRGLAPLAGQGRLADGTFLATSTGSSFPLGATVSVGSTSSRVPLVVLREA